jgi:hypothetical protein
MTKSSLDDVRVYNRALSAEEVRKLYTEGAGTKQNVTTSTGGGQGLSRGLIGHWTFDGKDVDWTSGKITDRSGNGNFGQIVGMATRTAPTIGKLGQALKFDGVDDYVNIGNKTAHNFSNQSFSYGAWIKINSIVNGKVIVGKKTTSGYPMAGYQLDITNDNGGALQAWVADDVDYVATLISGSNLSDNNWHHTFVVIDRALQTMTIFVDGVAMSPKDISTVDSVDNTENLIIGVAGNFDGKFPGSIDDVRLYNRALSASEVQQLYRLGR